MKTSHSVKQRCITALRCLLVIPLALLAGCTVPRSLWSQADTHYTAVKLKDWEAPAPAGDRTIRVLLVHGMNNFPFGGNMSSPNLLKSGAKTYAELAAQLATLKEGSQEWSDMVAAATDPKQDWNKFITDAAAQLHHPEISPPGYEFKLVKDPASGQVLGYTYTRTFGPNANGVKLKCYIANWGLASAVLKEKTFGSLGNLANDPAKYAQTEGDFSDFDPRLNSERAALNKLIKLNVMDWGLGDAALYLGDERTKFTIPVERALKQLLRESSTNDRIAIVTHSLGSTITFDVVASELGSEAAPVGGLRQGSIKSFMVSSQETTPSKPGEPERHALASNVAFYMFANQYGLLKMGNSDSLTKLNAALPASQLKARNVFVQIYAFTDPQDLLSYPLNLHSDVMSTCNVYVHNPGLNLGVLVEPLEVHINYKENSNVLRAILNSPDNVKVAGH